jgi:serine/threonine protein phosphatase PrpC
VSTTPAKTAIGQRYGDTHPGRKRRRNEDAFVCDPPLFAVADGMGGAQAGELASSLAAAALRERSDSDAGGEDRVVELIQEANRRVHQRALDDATASGMGTTMTLAIFDGNGTVTIGHVGDSRAYVLRDGSLEQLTDDHSLVAELVRRGELSPAEAEVHPQRSVITRALGTDPTVDVDHFPFETRPGDLFLLCSDGLTTMVDADTITAIVQRYRNDLRQAAQTLIETANDHGGEDNVTAVLFEVVAAGDEDVTETVAAVTAAGAATQAADEEETLHPEDRVPAAAGEHEGTLPPEPDSITTIVSAEEIHAALAADAGREAPAAAPDLVEAAPEAGHEEGTPAVERAEPTAPLWRKLLALLVIVALSALIVFLVLRGLAR